MTAKKDLPIYTLDIETDPFLFDRKPLPFQIGFFDGVTFTQFHSDDVVDCIGAMREFLQTIPPGIIYAHNGGRFDVLGYLMQWVIGRPMRVINNRIVKCEMQCGEGKHEIRDSYSIMPFRLGDYKGKSQKKDIEIWKLELGARQLYRDEITDYLRMDCVTLRELVCGFIAKFGLELTIGTTAMKQLKKFHSFETLGAREDADIRMLYFYGGRVDCLKSGILKGDFKLYDVNSMYPFVMANFNHPIGAGSIVGRTIIPSTCFLTVTGKNYRAFPTRTKSGGLDYTVKHGRFHVSIHEYKAATELGLFELDEVHLTYSFPDQGNFATFVNTTFEQRQIAKLSKDEIEAMLLKYELNSAYGKFAQSPENYKDQIICGPDVFMDGNWRVVSMTDMDGRPQNQFNVWERPSHNATRFNVATGASITGAARSVLMRAIAHSTNPVYCDTDSLLCERLAADKDENKLGSWKCEAEIDTAAIAGKKLYAFFKDGKLVKKANKGFKITGEQILEVCQGKEVISYNDAPTFKLDGGMEFVKRTARMTV